LTRNCNPALSDLGRALALNPEKAATYYLRADCHSNLGDFEKAIEDFNVAEEKGFHDTFSLAITRGLIYRSIGYPHIIIFIPRLLFLNPEVSQFHPKLYPQVTSFQLK
jgi:tetratricopeptide (TPR) repeat protein